MRACLAGRGGEVSARNRAARLAQTYLGLDEAGRIEFLRTLAGFDSDLGAVAAAFAAVQAADGAGAAGGGQGAAAAGAGAAAPQAADAVHGDPGRDQVPRRSARLPAGGRPGRSAARGARESISTRCWRAGSTSASSTCSGSTGPAPPSLLEKLVGYEAVHEIRSWRDLKNRLDSDRRCYAFFHPRMPTEPLIFVEVALVRGLADSVQRLLDAEGAGARSRRGGHRNLLLDQQLPGGPRRHQLRQFPHQARRASCWRPSFPTCAHSQPSPRSQASGAWLETCSGPARSRICCPRRKPPA